MLLFSQICIFHKPVGTEGSSNINVGTGSFPYATLGHYSENPYLIDFLNSAPGVVYGKLWYIVYCIKTSLG